jgi:hypothetical protein
VDKGLADLEKLSEYNSLWLVESLLTIPYNKNAKLYIANYTLFHSHRCGSCYVQKWFCNEIQQLPMVDDHGVAIRRYVVV